MRKDVDGAFDSPFGLAWAIIRKHDIKKQIKEIEKSNIKNQGIVNYQPSSIEAFFDENEYLGNVVLSGGNEVIRNRAIAMCMQCAYLRGYVPVLMHSNNYSLESYLISCFGVDNISILNGQFPYYDPFLTLTNDEICNMILNSTTENYEIKGLGKYYIDGISSFISSKNIHPYLWMYITCPHLELNNKVNDAYNSGTITEKTARNIMSQIVQGELERGNVERFFLKLRSEAEFILSKKKNLNKATNVNHVSEIGGAIVLDVRSGTNNLLINLVMSEIEIIKNKGKKVFLCLDGLPVSDNRLLIDYIKTTGQQSVICLSDSDVYSDFLGDDNLFFSMIGKTSKIIISKHLSANSAQRFSDVIGSYDKQEISDVISSDTNMVGDFTHGTTKSKNINIKREERVKAADILKLKEDEVFVLDNCNGELAHTTIV